MTNREKFIDKILAKIMLSALSYQSISDLGIKNSRDFLSLDDVVKWLNEECKEPEIEYMEVTNDIPRFTEIEVRDSYFSKWKKMLFLVKIEREHSKFVATNKNTIELYSYNQARVRKDWDKCKE